jgi:DNA-binding transcriptional LysR family regulator
VDALETELGLVLFERAGRGLLLTPSGLELLDHVRAMGEAAGRVSLAASGHTQSVEGSICITASEIYSAYVLAPIVAKLRGKYPGITVEIVASNAAIDLKRREADIAIRNFRPTQPDLIAKRLADDQARFYATPAYLESIGNPEWPEDLSRADFIGFDTTDVMINGLNKRGLSLTHKNFPVLTESHTVHWELCKQGAGIGVVPEELGDSEPVVKRVLPDFPPLEFPVWLTTHREVHTSRRVRIVFDFLVGELGRG